MRTVVEAERSIPVIEEADICVVGGSCTGVFAAIRAARLGAKVAVIEKCNRFGGTATSSLVAIWHSLYDTEFKQRIIGGLTAEFVDRLCKRGAATQKEMNPHAAFVLNTAELAIELDRAVLEHAILLHLHAVFSARLVEHGRLKGVIVENKSGRGAILARVFVDATGDADLAFRLGLQTYVPDALQPPTTCAHFSSWPGSQGVDTNSVLNEYREQYDLPEGFAWGVTIPGTDVYMLAGTRIYGVNPAEALDLTRAEMEGRRQVRAIMDILRKGCPGTSLGLVDVASLVGIRESRHVRCLARVTGNDVLSGRRFDDAIANGSYRVDVHHQEKAGITFKYLDGTQVYVRPCYPPQKGRWREETAENPTFYQVPYRALVPGVYENLILAGRMLDADREAFAALRVMVNMNQTGEAAGVAAYIALNTGRAFADIDVVELRKELVRGGSIIL